MKRNYEIAARVHSGRLSSASYEERRRMDGSRPEITEGDLERMRQEIISWTRNGSLR